MTVEEHVVYLKHSLANCLNSFPIFSITKRDHTAAVNESLRITTSVLLNMMDLTNGVQSEPLESR